MSRRPSVTCTQPVRRSVGPAVALLLLGTMAPLATLMQARPALAVPARQPARAQVLTAVSDFTAEERGDATVITLRCSAKPMFSVFKLERPARLNVDVANSEFRGVAPLQDVDSWAVGQVATARFRTAASTIARVMIAFRRPSHYTVRTDGNALVITVVANQPRPRTDPKRMARELQEAKQEASQARSAAQAAQGVVA